ncbi:hypothetical protein L6452_19329 [Arctium lappa]|uniref:Uncharacterized protein n=1 Tax=Arctium lappa TaxID=4217 RepID=A0ACB9B7P8_ARCLA|nr:hypothetical protein L6452_19329 [Arctium lappa]
MRIYIRFFVSTPCNPRDSADLLVYTVSILESPILSDSIQHQEPTKPPIVHVYNRRQRPTSDPDPIPSSSSSADPPNDDPPASNDPPPSDTQDPDLDVPIALQKSKRSCTYPISSVVSYDKLSSRSRSLISTLDSFFVPKTVGEALAHYGWQDAIIEEINALDHNNAWDLVELPTGKKAIGCKWVFIVKVNPDGSVARLKARLAAKGYAQTYGVDYYETFSHVAKVPSIRLSISFYATYDWVLYQLDVKNAFLHGDLHEEVYMEQPPRFVAQGDSGRVCKGDEIGIKKLKDCLASRFQTKDLGPLKYFLGIEVSRTRKGIYLSHRKYCLDVLNDSGMTETTPCEAPMIPNMKLKADNGDLLEDPKKYKRIVGKLTT